MNQNDFKHLFIKRPDAQHVILLLHGTGGDEHDLIPLSELLFPNASILSLRGNASENGLNRFFERLPDDSFNQETIRSESIKLDSFLQSAAEKYQFRFGDLIILGYSNGADFGLASLFLDPGKIHHAVLLHPILPFEPAEDISLLGTSVIATNGRHDPFATPDRQEDLRETLIRHGAELEWFIHDGGHEINEDEIRFVKEAVTRIV